MEIVELWRVQEVAEQLEEQNFQVYSEIPSLQRNGEKEMLTTINEI